jgi:hypothetical protein
MLNVAMSIFMLNVAMSVFMLNVAMSVFMLNVAILSVISPRPLTLASKLGELARRLCRAKKENHKFCDLSKSYEVFLFYIYGCRCPFYV